LPPGPEPVLRLFFGVPVPAAARLRLEAALRRLEAEGWRSSAAGGLHVTLRFLGDTPAALVPSLTAALREAARSELPFDVRVGRLIGLPDRRRARVAAAAVDTGAAPLARLSEALTRALLPLGIEPEARPFRPHLTLARSGGAPRAVPPGDGGVDTAFRVERLVLWESILGRPHARYRAVAEACLGPALARD
jgi:2'-5' RNA ligase